MKQNQKMIIGLPIVMVLGIPVPLAFGWLLGMFASAGIALVSGFLGYRISKDTQGVMTAGFRVGLFLLIYLATIWRAVEVLKEGEGFFFALYLAVIQPLLELLKTLTGKA